MRRIIVVDDQVSVAKVVFKVLIHKGYRVVVAFSVFDALMEIALSPSFNLIVTDYEIGLSGTCFDLISLGLTECRELFPRRVLVMSGRFPDDMTKQLARFHGEGLKVVCIEKPFEIDTLINSVENLFNL